MSKSGRSNTWSGAVREGRPTGGALAWVFLGLVALLVITGPVPWPIGALYATASLLAYVAYAVDKSAARRGAWRTKENTLHLLALAGGWPGALLAQQRFRHKTGKQSFQNVFRATAFLNCCALAFVLTPAGSELLQVLEAVLATAG